MGRESAEARLERHPLDPFKYIAPDLLAKIIGGLALWFATTYGVAHHEAAVQSAESDDQSEAVATVATYAAEQVDSLRSEVKRLKRQVKQLQATPENQRRLASAREAAASALRMRRAQRQPTQHHFLWW